MGRGAATPGAAASSSAEVTAGGGRPKEPRPLAAASSSAEVAAIAAELLEVFAEHAPEKSAGDVQRMLAKFPGREAELLSKMKEKYGHK